MIYRLWIKLNRIEIVSEGKLGMKKTILLLLHLFLSVLLLLCLCQVILFLLVDDRLSQRLATIQLSFDLIFGRRHAWRATLMHFSLAKLRFFLTR